MTEQAYIPGQYRQPAALTLQPPFWFMWTLGATATTYLREDLIELGAHFGVETWPGDVPALFILFGLTEAERACCQKSGQVFRSSATLDITGEWKEYNR